MRGGKSAPVDKTNPLIADADPAKREGQKNQRALIFALF